MKTERLVLPARPGLGRGAPRLEPRRRPAARLRSPCPSPPRTWSPSSRCARRDGLRVAPQGTGHNAVRARLARRTPCSLKTERMRGVADRRRDAGARASRPASLWADVTPRPPSTGSRRSPARRRTSASSATRSAAASAGSRASTASRRTASRPSSSSTPTATDRACRRATNEPDLFWALRGGGGCFGVVTALEFALLPDRARSTPASLFFPIERGAEVLQAWRAWVEDVPDEVTSIGRLPAVPADPGHPGAAARQVVRRRRGDVPRRRGGGRRAAAAAARARPGAWTRSRRSRWSSCSTCTWIREHPVPGFGDGMLLADLTPEAIDALVAVAGRRLGLAAPLASRCAISAARSRGRRPATARWPRSTRTSRCSPSVWRRRRKRWQRSKAHVERVQRGDVAVGRRSRLPQLHRAARAWRAAVRPIDVRRLQAVKAAVDPDDLFRSNHPVRLPASKLRKAA